VLALKIGIVGGHEKLDVRARRKAIESLRDLGRELRDARLNHDLSQPTAAHSAGMSPSSWSRLERGAAPGASIVTIASALGVVGLELSVRAYPGGAVLRDAGHRRLLERLRTRLVSEARWGTEVPFPNAGDRRAWDAVIGVAAVRIGVEAETRGRDSQELERRLALKRRDGGVDHILLLLANTRNNRTFVRALGDGFRTAFPVPGPVILARLAAGEDPEGSGIVLL
jgi:transcriptional regulator with XRE-family HTH domain